MKKISGKAAQTTTGNGGSDATFDEIGHTVMRCKRQ